MRRFRLPLEQDSPTLDVPGVLKVIGDVLHPRNFWVRLPLRLRWSNPQDEEIPWEIFRGRLIEPRHTRETSRFLAWNIYQEKEAGPGQEPLLSVKWDRATGMIHVVRGIESYLEQNGVEAVAWIRELIGAIDPALFFTVDEFRDEMMCLVWQAVVGTTRLALHSVEAPMPAFTLGQLAYLYRQGPETEILDLLALRVGNGREQAKMLECWLRSGRPEEIAGFAEEFRRRHIPSQHLWAWLRKIFLEVSLSPYTSLVDNTFAFVGTLVDRGYCPPSEEIDFLGWLALLLVRHLTAYDLVIFHQRGANYPDALLLDSILQRLLVWIEQSPPLFAGPENRQRRRALRQAWWVRRSYEGLPVPTAPTSPGENNRVWPDSIPRVSQEELLQHKSRTRTLFNDRPTQAMLSPAIKTALEVSLQDLAFPEEWAELGTALFIDRPLGWGKAVGEPDQTPLLAQQAYSASVARKRWQDWQIWSEEWGLKAPTMGREISLTGVPLEMIADPDRPVVSLADARKVADDFVVVRTMPGGLRAAWDLFEWSMLPGLPTAHIWVRIKHGSKRSVLAAFDAHGICFLEADTAGSGWTTRGGVELPAVGLRSSEGLLAATR